MKGYKLRHNGSVTTLTVPPEIARVVPQDMRFDCELTEDGILFRRRTEVDPEGLPSWATLQEPQEPRR